MVAPANLSGVARKLYFMSDLNNTFDPAEVFADPVAYLAQFDIDVELVTSRDQGLPLAA